MCALRWRLPPHSLTLAPLALTHHPLPPIPSFLSSLPHSCLLSARAEGGGDGDGVCDHERAEDDQQPAGGDRLAGQGDRIKCRNSAYSTRIIDNSVRERQFLCDFHSGHACSILTVCTLWAKFMTKCAEKLLST